MYDRDVSIMKSICDWSLGRHFEIRDSQRMMEDGLQLLLVAVSGVTIYVQCCAMDVPEKKVQGSRPD